MTARFMREDGFHNEIYQLKMKSISVFTMRCGKRWEEENMDHQELIYFGGYTKTEEDGIRFLEYKSGSYSFGELKLAAKAQNPSYLANGCGLLFACVETDRFLGRPGGGICVYRREKDGTLTLLSSENTKGDYPCHLCVQQETRTVFVSNYGSGNLSAFSVDENGKLSCLATMEHRLETGKKEAHAHCSALSRDGKTLYACDLGLDRVFVYDISKGAREMEGVGEICFPEGSGPRHLLVSDGNLYVACELSNEIFVADAASGKLLQAFSVLPKDAEGFAAASAIYADWKRDLLAVSVRGVDGICFFERRKDGLLEKRSFLRLDGSFPRDIHLFPDGVVLAAYEKGNYAELFRLKDGNQMERLAQLEVSCPTRILPV